MSALLRPCCDLNVYINTNSCQGLVNVIFEIYGRNIDDLPLVDAWPTKKSPYRPRLE